MTWELLETIATARPGGDLSLVGVIRGPRESILKYTKTLLADTVPYVLTVTFTLFLSQDLQSHIYIYDRCRGVPVY